jgi:2-keto-4-pentenoate hydratase/2-oxohepta-3-ene-1,7-dioic acid hydratase in catechol pathway
MLVARAIVGSEVHYGEVCDGSFAVLRGDIFSGARRTGAVIPLTDVQLLSPVQPEHVWVVVGGFVGEGPPPRTTPRLEPKIVSHILGDRCEIRYRRTWGPLQSEVELALVVGTSVGPATTNFSDAVFGYTIFNDVTAVDLLTSGNVSLSKSIDGYAAMGPWIRSDVADEEIRRGLELTTRVNGRVVQSGTTARFRYAPLDVLQWLARFVTLKPGDVVSLGTPLPVAVMTSGDQLELEISGIGILRCTMATEESDSD